MLAFLLSFGPAVSNSFARFAYALVLPAMRDDLLLNYAEAGWLNTANAAGYLIGALLTRVWVVRAGNRTLFIAGMVLTSFAVFATGLSREPAMLSLMRLLGGVGGAAVFICGGTLSGNVMPSRPALATTTIAIYFAGGGIGLMLCGAAIPLLLDAYGATAWPLAWQAMGVTAFVMTVASVWAALQIIEPGSGAGTGASRAPTQNGEARTPPRLTHQSPAPPGTHHLSLLWSGLHRLHDFRDCLDARARRTDLHRDHRLDDAGCHHTARAGNLAGPRRALGGRTPAGCRHGHACLRRRAAPAACCRTRHDAVGSIVWRSHVFHSFGHSEPGEKGIPMRDWGHAMAGFTIVFAAGQVAGPVLTGWLADRWGSLTPGLALSVVTLLAGSLLALTQHDVDTQQDVRHAR